MAIEILYFAWVREAVGCDGETISPPETVIVVADLLDWLSARSEAHGRALADRGRLRVAIDQGFAALDAPISGAREIAIFPPVTGG